jgi:leucyl aminopeptidase
MEETLKFQVKFGDAGSAVCDAVVIGLLEGTKVLSGPVAAIDKGLGGVISDLLKRGEVKGKTNETHVVYTLGKIPARMVLVAGLGKKKEVGADKVRSVMGESARVFRRHRCKSVAAVLLGDGEGGLDASDSAEAIVEGFLLGGYQFRKHLTEKDEPPEIADVTLLQGDSRQLSATRKGVEKGRILAEATILARDMVNEPANFMTPTRLAEIATEIAGRHGLEVVVMDRQRMEREKMGALLGVAQGSNQSPKFIVLRYRGDPLKREQIGFVGKGLTFDSGGISLKPQDYMSDMKGDMAGAAAVIAAVGAIAQLKLRINVTAVVPATENLPGGKALKPGDVLKAVNGKTIEVVNTDAEGRLILADALSYAVKNGISPLIDLATLTGACHVALGDLYAGVFTNDQALADRVVKAGKEAGESLWQLPLPEDYKEMNKSDVADIKNSGGRYGGAITAALFLQEFVGKTPWVHLDIAAPFMADKTKGTLVKGATGFGVRTLINVAIGLSKK